jgi:CheY-like chemotaxis protein
MATDNGIGHPEHDARGCAAAACPAPGALVVDDDPVVLELLRAVLGRRGFAVWAADSGPAAITLYEREHPRIAVVLLDVQLGAMDGPQTLAALQRTNPAVACYFMTGHSGTYSHADLVALGALDTIDKPFAVDAVAELLWQAAAAGRGA